MPIACGRWISTSFFLLRPFDTQWILIGSELIHLKVVLETPTRHLHQLSLAQYLLHILAGLGDILILFISVPTMCYHDMQGHSLTRCLG